MSRFSWLALAALAGCTHFNDFTFSDGGVGSGGGDGGGQMADLRCDFFWPPYDRLKVAMATHRDGDVAARVTVRFEEVFESLRLIRAICSGLPDGAARAEMRPQASASLGAGTNSCRLAWK